jgi:GPI-anchor transamidase subunit U
LPCYVQLCRIADASALLSRPLLPPHHHVLPLSDLSHPLFLLCLTLYSLFLLPTFHHLWLYSGQGNANFFYASTLVWTISQGGLLVDVMEARGKRGVMDQLEKEQGEKGEVRKAVREGRWTVQR